MPTRESATLSTVTPSASQITVNMPATRPDGDRYIAILGKNLGANFNSIPGNWNEIFNQDSGGQNRLGAWTWIGSSEPASYTIGFDAPNARGWALVYRLSTAGPIHNSATAGANAANGSAPTLNISVNNTFVIRALAATATTGVTATPVTEEVKGNVGSGGGSVAYGVSYENGAQPSVPSAGFTHSSGWHTAATIAVAHGGTEILRSVSDTISFIDSINLILETSLPDTISFSEILNLILETSLPDTVSFTDSINLILETSLSDNVNFTDDVIVNLQIAVTDTISFIDSAGLIFEESTSDILSLLDWTGNPLPREIIRLTNPEAFSVNDILRSELITQHINPFWERWSHASVYKHFWDRRGNYPVYLEGDERTLNQEAEFAEIRVDGPFILNGHKGCFILDIEVNVLLQVHMDPRQLYKQHAIVGFFSRLFTNEICLCRIGSTTFDDGLLIGAYHLQRSAGERVNISHFGILNEKVRLTQVAIEGHYRFDSFVI